MSKNNIPGRIKLLRDSVALRIAAGEVIDRPFSVVRELLDNSIDAGSTNIDLYIDEGGIANIRIVDNGHGMSREDLEICYLPYSTSKIDTMEDLDQLSTLGFRGEALSSIAACSKLEITSKVKNKHPNNIIIHSSKCLSISESGGTDGTVIDVSDLFYSIPARKKFLKRASAETTGCKKLFLEKALPFPEISFKFFSDKKLKMFLPASSLKDRIVTAYPDVFSKKLLHGISSNFKDYKIKIIAGDPALHRTDRRYIQIFLNKRKINEFAFVQAVEYGYSEFLPGGNYPVAFLFIDVDPSLVDFNIHPAKKEVRFRNLQEIHRSIVDTIKSFLSTFEYNYTKSISNNEPSRDFTGFTEMLKEKDTVYQHSTVEREGTRELYKSINTVNKTYFPVDKFKTLNEPTVVSNPGNSNNKIIYMGQLFNLFLLTAIDDIFYFIDQHAAHEKILFNEFKSKNRKTQELLIPYLFELNDEKEKLFITDLKEYNYLGFSFESLGNNNWQLLEVPVYSIGKEEIIVNFVQSQKGRLADLETELYANMACKSAIKDGDIIDNITAIELIEKTLNLQNARCPHGRPVWFQVSVEELFHFLVRL
ncbi:MAG: DNA mismatch repair endonuclease MutL [Spirochaetia bacterium]|jgi:DNA mismatch repair protein MutL|nr:DNA mismatch repair endonuclease MutL [Spirochaetia bacterium]